jgi:hypothetical protein
VVNTYGQWKAVFITWLLGTNYDEKGNYAHRADFRGVLNNLLEIEKYLETDASPTIAMTHLANLTKRYYNCLNFIIIL